MDLAFKPLPVVATDCAAGVAAAEAVRFAVAFMAEPDNVAVDVVITAPVGPTACTVNVPADSPSRLYDPTPLVVALPTIDPILFRAFTLTPAIGPAGPRMVPMMTPTDPAPADRVEI
jgi:hypothetical protein